MDVVNSCEVEDVGCSGVGDAIGDVIGEVDGAVEVGCWREGPLGWSRGVVGSESTDVVAIGVLSDEVVDIQGCGFTGVFVCEASEKLRLGDGVGGVLTTTRE